jgi:hypothetical protein
MHPMFEPSTLLRFESGARIQLDGVPPDQLALLRERLVAGPVRLKSVTHREVTFDTFDGDCSCAAQVMSVAWDPWPVQR